MAIIGSLPHTPLVAERVVGALDTNSQLGADTQEGARRSMQKDGQEAVRHKGNQEAGHHMQLGAPSLPHVGVWKASCLLAEEERAHAVARARMQEVDHNLDSHRATEGMPHRAVEADGQKAQVVQVGFRRQ
mmetsp:Transcript_23198/g.34945  ORF Transcript_23198/g.34945 Transcript_23198/m.34945 type:complete len:131 (-) Transcript_23198:33-425(-)